MFFIDVEGIVACNPWTMTKRIIPFERELFDTEGLWLSSDEKTLYCLRMKRRVPLTQWYYYHDHKMIEALGPSWTGATLLAVPACGGEAEVAYEWGEDFPDPSDIEYHAERHAIYAILDRGTVLTKIDLNSGKTKPILKVAGEFLTPYVFQSGRTILEVSTSFEEDRYRLDEILPDDSVRTFLPNGHYPSESPGGRFVTYLEGDTLTVMGQGERPDKICRLPKSRATALGSRSMVWCRCGNHFAYTVATGSTISSGLMVVGDVEEKLLMAANGFATRYLWVEELRTTPAAAPGGSGTV